MPGLHHGLRPRRGMRGQALTELAIAAAVIVPLFLLLPIIAKYGHARQMAQQAARNAAWETTVARNHALPTRGQLQAKVIDRNFATADTPIRSQIDNRATGEFGDPMLNTFSNRKLLERDNVRVPRLSEAASPGFASKLLGSFPTAFPGAFPPNGRGYVTAEVRLELRNLRTRDNQAATYLQPFDSLDLVMEERQTLLADAWNAAGPTSGARSVKEQVSSLVPSSNLEALEPVFDVIGALPIPMLGKLDDLDPGVIEPDIVPPDRLTNLPRNVQ